VPCSTRQPPFERANETSFNNDEHRAASLRPGPDEPVRVERRRRRRSNADRYSVALAVSTRRHHLHATEYPRKEGIGIALLPILDFRVFGVDDLLLAALVALTALARAGGARLGLRLRVHRLAELLRGLRER